MERLFDLRKSQLNHSTSSELGYETAHDDSYASLYYSLNNSLDNTLDTNAEALNNLNHSEDANESIDGEKLFMPNLQSTTTTVLSIGSTSNPRSNFTDSVTSVELGENSLKSIASIAAVLVAVPVPIPVPVVSVESNAYFAPSSAPISENENYVHPVSNSDSSPISTITSVDNQMHVSTRQVSKLAISKKCRIQFDFSNDLMKQRSSSVTVLEPALSSHIVSSSTAMRPHNLMAFQGTKSQRTLARFQKVSEIPQPSIMVTKQRGVLSSYHSSESIIPKSILKKSSSVGELERETVHVTGISSWRSYERESIVKKSPPRKSFHSRAGPSGLVKREFIAPKGNHICSICKKAFPLRSTLILHKMEHKDENLLTSCRYCDRSFQNPIAISRHLKDNCEKIPTAVRKRLLTEDFNKTNTYN